MMEQTSVRHRNRDVTVRITSTKCLLFEKTSSDDVTVVTNQFKREKAPVRNIRTGRGDKTPGATEVKKG